MLTSGAIRNTHVMYEPFLPFLNYFPTSYFHSHLTQLATVSLSPGADGCAGDVFPLTAMSWELFQQGFL